MKETNNIHAVAVEALQIPSRLKLGMPKSTVTPLKCSTFAKQSDETDCEKMNSSRRILVKKRYQKGGTAEQVNIVKEYPVNPKEALAVTLSQMGFPIDKIESAVLVAACDTLEEALKYLVKNSEGYWEHRPLNREAVLQNYFTGKCLACHTKKDVASAVTPFPVGDSQKVMPWDGFRTANGFALTNSKYNEYPTLKSRRCSLLGSHEQSSPDNSLITAKPKSSHVSLSNSRIINTEDAVCFICGDLSEFHQPSPHECIHRPVTSDLNRSTFEKPDISFCMICFEECKAIVSLSCGHTFCSSCLNTYFTHCISEIKQVNCPAKCCKHVVSSDLVLGAVGSEQYQAYLNKLKESEVETIVYCPCCSFSNKVLPQDKPKVVCKMCFTKFCTRCNVKWHTHQSCSKYIEAAYGKLCKGREWQLCPNCKRPVRRAPQCGHMMCPSCLLTFCISCRKRAGGPVDTENCPMHKKLTTTTRGNTKIFTPWIALLILLMYLIISPALALLIVPYIIGVNTYDWYMEGKREERKLDLQNEASSLDILAPKTLRNDMGPSHADNYSTVIAIKHPDEPNEDENHGKALAISILTTILAVLLAPITSLVGILVYFSFVFNR